MDDETLLHQAPFSTKSVFSTTGCPEQSGLWRMPFFGILANHFRVLLMTIQMEPERVTSLVMACVCLHNLMRTHYPGLQIVALDHEADNHQLVPGAWRDEGVLQDVQAVRGPTRAAKEAKQQRVYLKHYMNNIGAVPWQRDMI
jgi:hypothetical protein